MTVKSTYNKFSAELLSVNGVKFKAILWSDSDRIQRARFNLENALSCNKGSFISIRHKKIQNITVRLLKEVCNDIRA